MIKTKYTKGFEKFWQEWRKITGRGTDKPEAFRYWKRDRLEGDEDELIRILNLQDDERKRFKRRKEWIPEWCYCRKWLNNRRYEYVPEPPKKKLVKIRPLTEEEKKEYEKRYGPEARKRWSEYRAMVDKLDKKFEGKILSQSELNERRNQQIKALQNKD